MPLTYQKWKAEESKGRILSALHEGPKSFMELVMATGLSKPVLSEHLKALDGTKVKLVGETSTKRFVYTLLKSGLTDSEKAYIGNSVMKTSLVACLDKEASNKKISDKTYMRLFFRVIEALTLTQLGLAYNISPESGREWIESTYGRDFYGMLPKLLPPKRLRALSMVGGEKAVEVAHLIHRINPSQFSRNLLRETRSWMLTTSRHTT